MRPLIVIGALSLSWAVARAADPGVKPDGVADLIQKLDDPRGDVRRAAAHDLGDLGAAARLAVPALGKTLRDVNAAVRVQARRALAAVGAAAVPELIQDIKDGDPKTRWRATEALAKIGPDAKDAVSALADALKDKDAANRGMAAVALGEIGPDAKDAVPDLIRALKDREAEVWPQVVAALAHIGANAVPALSDAVTDKKVEVRLGAVFALGQMGSPAADALPALTLALTDKEVNVRVAAAAALTELGPKAAPAAPALVASLEEEALRPQAFQALIHTGTKAIPELRRALKNGQPTTQSCCLLAFAQLGPQAEEAVGDLNDLLKERNPTVRAMAAFALGQVGPKAKAAVPNLNRLVEDPDLSLKATAALAVAQILPNDVTALRRAADLAALVEKARQAQEERAAAAAVGINSADIALLRQNDERQARFNQMMDQHFDPRREARYDQIVQAVLLAEAQDMDDDKGDAFKLVLKRLPPDSIFAVIRGVQRGRQLPHIPAFKTRECATGELGNRVGVLIDGIRDPLLLNYVFLYLQRHDPWSAEMQEEKVKEKLSGQGYSKLDFLKCQLQSKLIQQRNVLQWTRQADLIAQANSELAELQRRQQDLLHRVVRGLSEEPAEDLKKKLTDADPLTRFLSTQVAGARRLHLETDLIDLLNDRDAEVRQTARQALVRLGRGVDFGPGVEAAKSDRLRAMARWRGWLALQDPAAGAAAVDPFLNGGKIAVARLDPDDAEIARLAWGLVEAPAEQQDDVLAKLRDAKGVLNTEALAVAVPQLPEPNQAKARDALAERLSRMTAKTLRDKFADDDAEVRRAAARAAVRKAAKEHIPDLLKLLEDEEPPVVQAARSALKDLTGEDFGPDPDANRLDRLLSLAAWQGWHLKQQADKK